MSVSKTALASAVVKKRKGLLIAACFLAGLALVFVVGRAARNDLRKVQQPPPIYESSGTLDHQAESGKVRR